MKPHNLKLKNYDCFGENWIGFEEFKPITIIIGRNNSGKSRLLDLIEVLSKTPLNKLGLDVKCSAKFTEKFLEECFSKTHSGGELSPNMMNGGFHKAYSHWNIHGQHLIGFPVSWEIDSSGKVSHPNFEEPEINENVFRNYSKGRAEVIARQLPKENDTLLFGKTYRRILADRDIQPEKPDPIPKLSRNGNGATNLIRKLIVSSAMDEDKVQVDLCKALDEIFGKDGTFDRVEIRVHDTNGNEDKNEDRWEVYLGEPSKGLVPLGDSGSGLKTVILVLLNVLIIPYVENKNVDEYVFAFEELENNLHPALLRRLFNYLAKFVQANSCRLFLTTHSSTALDFFGPMDTAQIMHVRHDGKIASVKTVSHHFDSVSVVNELGAKPSDILQANGVIWLEGPSDRIYINKFLELFSAGSLREGRDYQCAYYSGSILANVEFTEPGQQGELANLLRINSNVAVVCDGDRTSAKGTGSRLKKRVLDIKKQVGEIEGSFLWITDAKEIENYIPGEIWKEAYSLSANVPDPTKYDQFPTRDLEKNNTFVFDKLGRKSFDKCEFAAKAARLLDRKMLESRFELCEEMLSLVQCIKGWNH